MSALIQNSAPLQANYIPASFVDREDALPALSEFSTAARKSGLTDLIVQGPRGVGKLIWFGGNSTNSATPSQPAISLALGSTLSTRYSLGFTNDY